jgi:Tol biopolymer transport system component
LSGGTAPRQVTFEGNNRYAVWSNDGRRLTFQSSREGDLAIYTVAAEGGAAVRVTRPAKGEVHVPEAWSRDGRRLLYTAGPEFRQRTSLRVLDVADGTTIERPFGSIRGASFSPDGRWVAYSLDGFAATEVGVFVEPFPPTGQRLVAPRAARDFHPVWASDGKGLFYQQDGQRLVSIPFRTEPSVAFEAPVQLARAPRPEIQSWQPRGYDVLPDGRIVSVSALIGSSPESPYGEIRVVLNWFEELKRLVPTR